MMSNTARTRLQAGFSMIEVLVTIVIVSLGLLGFAGLQAYSLKSNRVALQRSYATMLAYDIVDCMRVNRPAAIANEYDFTLNADTSPTSGDTLAQLDLTLWRTALLQALPNGEGQITVSGVGATRSVQIDIRWNESLKMGEDEDSNRTLEFSTQTSL